MGNFAENLNLGNRFRPPMCIWPFVDGATVISMGFDFLQSIHELYIELEEHLLCSILYASIK